MLGLDVHGSGDIRLQGIEFYLRPPEVRSEIIWPEKLNEGIYTIDYSVTFPDRLPAGWCICLQFLQVSTDNSVKNPTLQMNVNDTAVYWQHKTDLIGAGDVFCESDYFAGIEDKWTINTKLIRQGDGWIEILRNGTQIGRIDGQTLVDVDQDVTVKYGLYSRVGGQLRSIVKNIAIR